MADPSHSSIPMFRTLIRTQEVCTGQAVYHFPENTQYDKRLNYQTYGISDQIGEGENRVGVTLASGWWSDAQTFTVKNYNFWGDKVSGFYGRGLGAACVYEPVTIEEYRAIRPFMIWAMKWAACRVSVFGKKKEPALLSGMEKCSIRICRNMRQGIPMCSAIRLCTIVS